MESMETKYRCKRCNKKLSSEQCKYLGKYCFCYECANLPEGVALTESGDRFYFYFPVADLFAENEYWSNAVDMTDRRSRSDNSPESHGEEDEIVDRIRIRTTEDFECATDPEYDWDVVIWVYANSEKSEWYFELQEEFLSTWDDFPSSSGGAITAGEAKEYLHRIGNHKYDHLFEK